MNRIIRDKTFYRTFFALTLSLALQSLLSYSVNLADNVMLGAYSETALSGSSLCNQIQFLLQLLCVGGGQGAVVLGSRYWGENRLEPIPHIIGCALRYCLLIALVLFGLAFLFPSRVLGLLTNDTAVIGEGVKYLRIICFTYLIYAVTTVLVTSLRSIGVVRIGYVISFSTLCINICLNSLLIYGRLGFPEMGIAGAAIATLVSRMVELTIVILYLKFREHRLCLTFRKLVFIDTSYLKDYHRVSAPVLLGEAQWGLAQMVQTGILGHLGAAAIAANSIATLVFQIVTVVAYGSAAASVITVGKTVGEGNEGQLKSLVKTLEMIYLINGLVSGALIFLVRNFILSFYRITPEAHALALQFMLILSITSIGTGYQMAVSNGIIQGGGDTSFNMKLNLISMWLIVVPGAAAAAFLFHCKPVVVFFFLKWDQLYKTIPVVIRLRSWKWVKKVTRA